LVAATSDHSPILLKLEQKPHIQQKRSFRFENSWLLYNSLVDMITSNWPYYPASNIPQKLKYCIGDMEAWSKENSPNFRETANKLRRELELIRSTHDHLSDASITNVQISFQMFYCRRTGIGSKELRCLMGKIHIPLSLIIILPPDMFVNTEEKSNNIFFFQWQEI
jgi:hypothetical protein